MSLPMCNAPSTFNRFFKPKIVVPFSFLSSNINIAIYTHG